MKRSHRLLIIAAVTLVVGSVIMFVPVGSAVTTSAVEIEGAPAQDRYRMVAVMDPVPTTLSRLLSLRDNELQDAAALASRDPSDPEAADALVVSHHAAGAVARELGRPTSPAWLVVPSSVGEIRAPYEVGDIIIANRITFDEAGVATQHTTVLRDGVEMRIAVEGRAPIAEPIELPQGRRVPLVMGTRQSAGTSGGLMTALAELDAATPGSLAGAHSWVGTGQIESDGSVVRVDMVAEKVAAQPSGSTFLLPAENMSPDVVAAAGEAGVTLQPVATLHDAVVFLCGQPGVDDAVCAQG